MAATICLKHKLILSRCAAKACSNEKSSSQSVLQPILDPMKILVYESKGTQIASINTKT
jgi:hypothetical protein